MSFLAPLFLLGAAAAILPVVFHLIRRTTRQKTIFSSLLFLPPSPPRVTQRSRLEDLLLLLLRCLVLGLLALGFARPFLKHSAAVDPSSQPPKRVIVLVDTSASMRRAGLWQEAQARAVQQARAAAPIDEVALWAFDHAVHPLITFSEWSAMPASDRAAQVSSRLQSTQPGWGGTRLDVVLTAAAEGIVETQDRLPQGAKRIVLITDFQEGSQLEQLQAFEWPKGIEVTVEPLKPKAQGNAGIQILAESTALPTTTQSVARARIINAADSTVDRFEVGWVRQGTEEFSGTALEVQVPPGQVRTVVLPVPTTGSGSGDRDGQDAPNQILLRGDAEPFDNRAFVVPPASQPLRALYFGNESQEEQRQPLFFLRRALPPTGRLAVDVTATRAGEAVDAETLRAASLYFVTDALAPAVAAELHTQVRGGKLLVFAPRNVDAFTALGPILGTAAVAAEEGQPRNYAMLGKVDFQHPLLAPFADPRFSDFTRIHFWKYRRFDDAMIPGAQVVWRFDSGDPALLEAPVGQGMVVVLASGWHPEDSQLALSTKFVPLLLSLIELRAHGGVAPAHALVVGDVIAIPPMAPRPLTLRKPDGTVVELSAGESNTPPATVPGIYELVAGQTILKAAVNLEGSESRTLPMPLEALEAVGAPLQTAPDKPGPTLERKLQLAAFEAENRQKLWRWLIVAALVVLVLESALAGWQSRSLATGKETAS